MVKLVDGIPSYKHPLYKTWKGLKARCYNEKRPDYYLYGGRGITICTEWINSFEQFVIDMGLKPDESFSLDRIDNNLGYSKDNCRWASPKDQANNRRDRSNKPIAKVNSKTGIRYISPSRGGYVVQVTRDKVHKNLGRFKDLEEAKEVLKVYLESLEYLQRKYG